MEYGKRWIKQMRGNAIAERGKNMKKFMDENFLLETKTAQELFHNVAKIQPIYDYHCHLNTQEIYEDKRFQNITEMWLGGDHYKWRLMRAAGIEERCITGDAPDEEKFTAYCRAIQCAVGNPLYHWSHLELRRYFGVEDILTEKNAPVIWDRVNAAIRGEGFSARELIRKSNVALIGTTDDPADALTAHQALRGDASFHTKVVPTFRPDNAIHIEKEGFAEYMERLGESAGIRIASFDDLKQALSRRMDYFAEQGCKISDHSLGNLPFGALGTQQTEQAFAKALAHDGLSRDEIAAYQTEILLFLGREYARRGWVMQLHLSALRNNSSRMYARLGADAGFDSIGDARQAEGLSRFMDALDSEDLLPKAVLYSLNPCDLSVLAAMAGNFQSGGVRGKIQLGSAWWFNDHIDGMTEQMKTLANMGHLDTFVGMLTDSRSLLSYPRHEYFRRILCNIVGGWVEDGLFPNDDGLLEQLISGVSCRNAAEYFDM